MCCFISITPWISYSLLHKIFSIFLRLFCLDQNIIQSNKIHFCWMNTFIPNALSMQLPKKEISPNHSLRNRLGCIPSSFIIVFKVELYFYFKNEKQISTRDNLLLKEFLYNWKPSRQIIIVIWMEGIGATSIMILIWFFVSLLWTI